MECEKKFDGIFYSVQVFMNRIITGSCVSARPARLTCPSWSSCRTRQLQHSALPVDDSFR